MLEPVPAWMAFVMQGSRGQVRSGGKHGFSLIFHRFPFLSSRCIVSGKHYDSPYVFLDLFCIQRAGNRNCIIDLPLEGYSWGGVVMTMELIGVVGPDAGVKSVPLARDRSLGMPR